MIVWEHLSIHSADLPFEKIVKNICRLPNHHSNWSLSSKKTVEFTEHLGEVAGVLINKEAKAYFCINSNSDYSVQLSNIISCFKNRSIAPDEYRILEEDFCHEVKKMLIALKLKMTIRCGARQIGLKQIIPAKIPRVQFERYVGLYPTSYHPCDINRLDKFICLAHRYCRKKIEIDVLKTFLRTDLKWNPRDADWCIDRIQTGFEILEANKR